MCYNETEKADYQYFNSIIPLRNTNESSLNGFYREIADHWAKILKISPTSIEMNNHFIFDLGGDSLMLIDLLNQFETIYNIPIIINQIKEYLSLKEMTDYLETQIQLISSS